MRYIFILLFLSVLTFSILHSSTSTRSSETTYIELEGFDVNPDDLLNAVGVILDTLKVTFKSNYNPETKCVLVETPSKTFVVCPKK